MTIGMVAPPWYSIPPRAYGGIEWIIHWLTKGLVHRGHGVVLVAAGRPRNGCQFHGTFALEQSTLLGLDSSVEAEHAAQAQVILSGVRPHIVHDHLPLRRLRHRLFSRPTVLTAHRAEDSITSPCEVPSGTFVVALSKTQAASSPRVPWADVIPLGVPLEEFPFSSRKRRFALFLGRLAPEKGAHLAADAARAAGIPLVIAGRCTEPREIVYFATEIRPRLGSGIRFVGQASTALKKKLLSTASCLLFPITDAEPFGLVLIEAQASGTPVVALRVGSVAEIVADGVTGWIVDDPSDLPAAIGAIGDLCPSRCRDWVGEEFGIDRMVERYLRSYHSVV